MDTEEDAFWSHLETNPSDSVARLVFADWLQERGDLRAEGMRVLGRFGKQARKWQDVSADPTFFTEATGYWIWAQRSEDHSPTKHKDTLGPVWFGAFSKRIHEKYANDPYSRTPAYWHVPFREVESAAALAWLDLTQEERDGICKLD